MPVFEYKALNSKGKTVKGIIDSESVAAARQKLRTSGIFPVAIKETYKKTAQKEDRFKTNIRLFKRIKPSEIAMMTRQLATLLSAGFPLVNAMSTLIPQTQSHALKATLSQIKDSIEEGSSFAEALTLYPGIFSPIYLNMVRAGETSGTLEIVLERLADITEKQQALNRRIGSALAYPVLMAFIGTGVLFLLLTFIVPSITSIFADMNQALPAPTEFLISFSKVLKSYWWLIFIVCIGTVVGFKRIGKTTRGRRWVDKTTLTLPLAGTLIQKLAVARFTGTLGSLLENGVPMLTALDIVKNIVGNVLIADAVQAAAQEVEQGHELGAALSSARHFPYLALQMIQVGEQSGKLEAMLNKIATVYENEVESSIAGMTALLEPVIILIMGVVVGFIVLSIMLPIFEMNQLIK